MSRSFALTAAHGWTEKEIMAEMKFTASKGFTDDMAKIVLFCIENKTNRIDIEFTLNDGKKAIVEMTIKAEGR